MSDKDYIKDIFSDKLGGYEAKVNPELWNGIASQIGAAGTTTAATGMSVFTKWIIGASIASVVTISAVVIMNSGEEEAPVNEDHVAQTEINTTEETNSEEDNTSSEVVPSNSEGSTEGNNDVVNTDPEVDPEPAGVAPVVPVIPVGPSTPVAENKPAETKTPLPADPKQPAENNTPPPVENREPVHTPDPIVHEPSFPAEIAPEENVTSEVNYSIGALPNVFTPNGDRENDYLQIESENLTDFSITVLNSDNAVVYQSADPDFSWDGRNLTGEPVPDGNYVYFITAREFSKDKPKRFSPLLIKRSR